VVWPRDLLVKDLESSTKARAISFGYDSGVVHSDVAEITQGSIDVEARSLCSQLNALRLKDGTVREPKPKNGLCE
jgi:hypothetical protein